MRFLLELVQVGSDISDGTGSAEDPQGGGQGAGKKSDLLVLVVTVGSKQKDKRSPVASE